MVAEETGEGCGERFALLGALRLAGGLFALTLDMWMGVLEL